MPEETKAAVTRLMAEARSAAEPGEARRKRVEALASTINVPDDHKTKIVATLDGDGNATLHVAVHVTFGEDSDDQTALVDTVATTHEIEMPAALRKALADVLEAELETARAKARVSLAEHILAAV